MQKRTVKGVRENRPADGPQEFVRQQYTFSPAGATSEVEDLAVELACASLAEWRLA